MRLFTKMILAAVLAISAFGAASAAPEPPTTTLRVYVETPDHDPLAGADVILVNYGMNGPTSSTQFEQTDAQGFFTFTVSTGQSFNLYVNKHGYSPTVRDQFNNPDPLVQRYFWTMPLVPIFSTFTVVNDQVNVGQIRLPFTNATPNKVLFGGVNIMGLQEPGFFGMVKADGSGTGTLSVDNVPYALANTYSVNIYDPEKNRGINRNVMTALGSGTSPIVFLSANFDNSIPPARIENTATQNSGSGSGAGVEGVIQDVAYSSSTLPHMGLNFHYCHPSYGNSRMWANSDDNGRFQLFGLLPGVTYYSEIMGGCVWSQSGPGGCYAPYRNPGLTQDLCVTSPPPPAPGLNDFLYVSSADVTSVTLKLARMPKSAGFMSVYVKASNGALIPNSNVNINPDGSSWTRDSVKCAAHNAGDDLSNPGFANANVTATTGYALLDGLPSGNYVLNVWTPFSNGGNSNAGFNSGPDGQSPAWGMNSGGMNWQQAHCAGAGVDDYRVTIDTDSATNGGKMLHVYDSSGTDLNLSSITYIVQTGTNLSGLVKGTIKFPGIVDLRETPVMITLYARCEKDSPCAAGNFTAISGQGASSYPYTINVASGAAYYMNVSAAKWGRVNRNGGDNTIHLESTGTAVVDMEFTPAGILTGTMYKPDGTIFTPENNQYIWVGAGNNSGWSNTQLQKDGTFIMTDVLPGLNRINVGASSGGGGNNSFTYSLASPAPTANVTAGSTATVNLNLVNASYVGLGMDLAKLPDPSVVSGGGSDLLLGFKAVPLPAGSVFTSDTIIKMLTGGDSDLERKFRYAIDNTATSGDGQCGSNWPGGFCPNTLPSPGVYDFYLMHTGDFGKGGDPSIADLPYPHFTMFNAVKNVIVDTAHSTATLTLSNNSGGGTASGVLVNLTPAEDQHARGNARLAGSVTAANFFRQADYEATGGDFDKFVQYLPVVALYDSNGVFSAAGIVVPPPSFIASNDDRFDLSFSQGYPAFKALLAEAGSFGYEIRSLKPSTCYTAVFSTPNYPHYQSRVCTGANGTRVALNVNLDAEGAGATVLGVVKSSDVTPGAIANASVELNMEGSVARTALTTSSGTFRFEGLSGGIAKITITAPGYAKTMIEEQVRGNNTYQEAIFLSSAPGSITGTVYSQKLPFAKVQPGAQIVAYDDTYNGNNPLLPLPLLKTMTGADGSYTLDGLVPGDVYKVFLKVPGKYTLNVATAATTGVLAGVDFTMLPKPLDVEVFAKDNKDLGRYEFTILNPQDFKGGTITYGPQPYAGPGTEITNSFSNISSGELFGFIPRANLTENQVYVLHIEATSLSNKTLTKELLFGKNYNNSQQNIDDIMLGDDSDDGFGRKNNEASVDKTGSDPSALVLPAGALLASSAAVVPSCSFTAEDKNSLAVSTKVAAVDPGATVAGNLYTVALSSVTQTARDTELTLAYDKSLPDVSALTVSEYNKTTGKWDSVPGLATVNPVKGTITVKLKKLASVLSVRNYGPEAVFDGRQYVVRPRSSGGGTTVSRTFTVLNYLGGALPAGSTKLKVFNYPNPFNLKARPVSSGHGVTIPSTKGTIIHVEVPAANSGACHIRIYTLAGELVKDISDTCTGGNYNYFAWDGRNKSGQEVANGVYYGVVELSGKSPDRKDATFKMAVIK